MAITPKKKPNRIYMTDDNSGVIYSDKQGNVISKDEAMKNFRDSASAEKREKRRSSQYEKKNKGGEMKKKNERQGMEYDRPVKEGEFNLRNKPKVIKVKSGGLTGGQKKLDVNNDGKISGEDFKILKGKNNKMKGGGIAIKGTNFKGVF